MLLFSCSTPIVLYTLQIARDWLSGFIPCPKRHLARIVSAGIPKSPWGFNTKISKMGLGDLDDLGVPF